MTCDDDPRFCLGDHIRPHLEGWSSSGPRSHEYQACCPVRTHADRHPSLSVGIGDRRRIVWCCHAGCSEADVRAALVRAGVPDGCLPRVRAQRTEDELVTALTVILEQQPPGPLRDLLIATLLWHRGKLPRGRELVALGKRAGLSRRTTYRVTASARPGTTVTDTRQIASVRSGTPVSDPAQPRYGSTSGFGAIRNTGVGTSVSPKGSPSVPLSVTPLCEQCGTPLDPRQRADARFHAACRQKAYRARRKSGR